MSSHEIQDCDLLFGLSAPVHSALCKGNPVSLAV
jgi:hypothetical protein